MFNITKMFNLSLILFSILIKKELRIHTASIQRITKLNGLVREEAAKKLVRLWLSSLRVQN